MSWADHFNTYQDACDFYGCDGPNELAAEARYFAEEEAIETQDAIEAAGGVQFMVAHHFKYSRDIEF